MGNEHEWKTDDEGESMYEVRYDDGDFEPLVSRALIMVQCEMCTHEGVPIAKLDANAKKTLLGEAAENNAPHLVKVKFTRPSNSQIQFEGCTFFEVNVRIMDHLVSRCCFLDVSILPNSPNPPTTIPG